LILNDSQPIQNAEELREQLADTTKQSVKISREIESLISQNTALRNENQSLKNSRKQSVILYE
jgi:regulator of replication initiation timing